jgi:hypothetical protein
MSKKQYDVVATVGEYTAANGVVKKRYVTCGAVFENDKGNLSLKLESIPVGQEWTGWLSLFEPKPRDGQQPAATPKQAYAQQNQAQDGMDDVPF